MMIEKGMKGRREGRRFQRNHLDSAGEKGEQLHVEEDEHHREDGQEERVGEKKEEKKKKKRRRRRREETAKAVASLDFVFVRFALASSRTGAESELVQRQGRQSETEREWERASRECVS